MAEKDFSWKAYLLGLITLPAIGFVATTVATLAAIVVGQRSLDKAE